MESIAAYVAELHHFTEHCEFADLEDMLRDQLVCGAHDSHIQLNLLPDTKLTFKINYATTQAVEAVDKQVKTLHNNDSTTKFVKQVRASGKPNANGRHPHTKTTVMLQVWIH